MELKQQVTSVELSNKLHKLGVTTPSVFYRDWTDAKEEEVLTWTHDFKSDYCPDNVNCYTVAELGEMLQYKMMYWGIERHSNDWRAGSLGKGQIDVTVVGDTMSDTLARMIIHLLENNLLNK